MGMMDSLQSVGSSFKKQFASSNDEKSTLGPEGHAPSSFAEKHPNIYRGLKAASEMTKKPLPKAPASRPKGEDEPLPNSGIMAATRQKFQGIDQPDEASTFKPPQVKPQGMPMSPSAENMAPISSLKKGTDYVPKTGVYKLHEGEKVVPKKDNESLFGLIPGRTTEKPSKKEIKNIVVKKAHGGFLVNHEHHNHPNEEHAVSNIAELHKHLDKHDSTMTASQSENE